MSSRNMPIIWEFLTVDEDTKFAICDEYEAKVTIALSPLPPLTLYTI